MVVPNSTDGCESYGIHLCTTKYHLITSLTEKPAENAIITL